MSVFTRRTTRFLKPKWTQTRSSVNKVTPNPALNTNPAYWNKAVMPFGIDFIDDDLRAILTQRGVDCDSLERAYFTQCQDDAEFNSPRLPRSYDSKLWGYIYGQRLVSAQSQLDTLTSDEKYQINYLNETVSELTMRMNRFYPSLDYKAQIEACKNENSDACETYTNAYNQALADIISENPTEFIKIFKNNAFIPAEIDQNDSDDKYGDYLSEDLEKELVANYEFNWDFNSALHSGFEGYYARMNTLESIIAPKLDSLSKNVRKNFADFLLNSFNQNAMSDIEYVISVVENATQSIVSADLSADMDTSTLATNCIDLLEEMSSSGALVSKLFFGNANSESESALNGKSKEELVSVISQSVSGERLCLINKSLQIYDYLKYNSVTRLVLSCLVKEYSEYFAQFLNENTGETNMDNFSDLNNDILDKIVSQMGIYYENQTDLGSAYQSLCKKVESECGNKSVTSAIDLSAFDAPKCYVTQILDKCAESAKANGDVCGQIKYLTFSKYVQMNGANISGLNVVKGLMNSKDSFSNMAFMFATNGSDANDLFLTQITDFMKQNACVANKSELAQSAQSELDNFREIAMRYNESRENLEASIAELATDFNMINFEYAKTNYDPLSVYLATFRYYNNK